MIPAEVPGNVELDLVRAGRLPELFSGQNIMGVQKLEHHEWWYRREFATPPRRAEDRVMLRFEGIDCFATVWVNGAEVGRADNMLIPHHFDATEALQSEAGRPNELAVHIRSAVEAVEQYPYDPDVGTLPHCWHGLWARKAPHMYGWDILPRAVSAGLWRSVFLEVVPPFGIADVFYQTRAASRDHAAVSARWRLRAPAGRASECRLRFTWRGGDEALVQEVDCDFIAGECHVQFGNPRLWWPRNYGEPDRYEVTCDLIRDGEVIDTRVDMVGLRTVELVRTDVTTPERPGEFLFKVNGQPILAMGTNWVPADAFHSRDRERVGQILALVDDLGCNMVRCWGGNVYEDHEFFEFCDRHGILVWQDFAMACARYPQRPAFQAALRREAESVVTRLRNHPSLAVWCGDNECDDMRQHRAGRVQNVLTREVLPGVVAQLDPSRPYLPSSPYITPEAARLGVTTVMPEQHLWGPRDYFKSSFYTQHTAHFVSEIGYHGCPNVSSLKRFLSPEALWPWEGNEEWRIHAADTFPEPGPFAYRVELMAKQIRELFGCVPETLDEYARASQFVQAEAKKFFVEMTRIGKWRRTGVLWWNVCDGWSQFSDAIVDYYFGKKLAYWILRRVQQSVCVMLDEPREWHARVMLGNDSPADVSGHVTIRDADTKASVFESDFSAPPHANRELGRVAVSHGIQQLLLIEWEANGARGVNHYLHGSPPFDLACLPNWLEQIASLGGEFDPTAVGQ